MLPDKLPDMIGLPQPAPPAKNRQGTNMATSGYAHTGSEKSEPIQFRAKVPITPPRKDERPHQRLQPPCSLEPPAPGTWPLPEDTKRQMAEIPQSTSNWKYRAETSPP